MRFRNCALEGCREFVGSGVASGVTSVVLSDGEPSDDELSENVSEKMLINLLGKLSAESVDEACAFIIRAAKQHIESASAASKKINIFFFFFLLNI